MSLTKEEAHKLIDTIFNLKETKVDGLAEVVNDVTEEVPARKLPEGKRVVRTKASGDRVYLLDDIKKTRSWVTNPDVLDSLGFTLNDVGEVEEDEMLKYQMSSALYRRVDEQ